RVPRDHVARNGKDGGAVDRDGPLRRAHIHAISASPMSDAALTAHPSGRRRARYEANLSRAAARYQRSRAGSTRSRTSLRNTAMARWAAPAWCGRRTAQRAAIALIIPASTSKIGRASCRERLWLEGVG